MKSLLETGWWKHDKRLGGFWIEGYLDWNPSAADAMKVAHPQAA